MDTETYFSALSEQFEKVYGVAKNARSKGFDPKDYVEVIPAQDLAGRVEGLIDIKGIADLIRKKQEGKTRSALAFAVAKEICTEESFSNYEKVRRVELAVKIGTAIITEGVLVAPTEGISTVNVYRNPDGTEYIAVVYAGPIRGAGGTGAALSVALADFSRKLLNIGPYKATNDEVERCVEEIELYHTRCARLQYRPSDDDIRTVLKNCQVCIDGVPTEQIEVGVHANLSRLDKDGKTTPITNKVRGGIALVTCEGIAQKAKKMVKETKEAGLDWGWLAGVIKTDVKKDPSEKKKGVAVFLEELVAGRPVIAYPGYVGGLRLRYGRSRFTGIAAKGFSPATMLICDGFIASGTQLKVELPGKGCVAMPVDSIEGPFVRLRSGEALRINDAKMAREVKGEVEEILSLGDILITYGDFKKTNTHLQPSSYVEEIWEAQLEKAGVVQKNRELGFDEAYELSLKHGVPLHPRYLYEFQAIGSTELQDLASIISISEELRKGKLSEVEKIVLTNEPIIKRSLELINVPHKIEQSHIVISRDHARSLLVSLGFAGADGVMAMPAGVPAKYDITQDQIAMLNAVSSVKLMKRSTFLGGRIGRPEKSKERLMKPAVNVLFPVGSHASKDRNITKAYNLDSRKLKSGLTAEIANYKCPKCLRTIDTQYCYDCDARAALERKCPKCFTVTVGTKCPRCNTDTMGASERSIDLHSVVGHSMKRLGINKIPDVIKGVQGLSNKNKVAEHLEKGILRTQNGVYIFKDGTARFDATDVPITHFYPKEIGVPVEKLRALGYGRDFEGNELTNEEQLVELRHQDVILNRRGADYMLKVSRFVDQMLEGLYGMERYYNAMSIGDLVGTLVITLAPHTSCAVLGRIIGFTDANIGFAHPYTICARRRNCDGDEDTTMLLLDALINFSKEFLPLTVGGTMDTPLILTLNVYVDEIDDEVHEMEAMKEYPMELYEKSYVYASPSEVKLDLVGNKLKTATSSQNIWFTHASSANAIADAPKRTLYTQLKTMQEKVDAEFSLMNKIYAVNKKDAARRVITSHFIPDLIGNLHSFSRQQFRCASCNAKYRRVPLAGKCTRDGGKLLLTISKGGIEKYLNMAINLADRYELDAYIRQRLALVKDEIDSTFIMQDDGTATTGQFNLSRFI